MKESRFIALSLLGMGGTLFAVGLWVASRPKDYVFDNGLDLPSNVSGKWDWSTRGTMCADSAHVIAFSDDAKTMTITHPRPTVDSSGRDWTVSTYDILSIGPSRIRGAIRGETRLTDEGVPVVWDLVVVGPDEYTWHRTDWVEGGYTPSVVRCPPAASGPG